MRLVARSTSYERDFSISRGILRGGAISRSWNSRESWPVTVTIVSHPPGLIEKLLEFCILSERKAYRLPDRSFGDRNARRNSGASRQVDHVIM